MSRKKRKAENITPLMRQRRVVFTRDADIEAVALAQIGMSDDVVRELTGLTAGQIAYRLREHGRVDPTLKALNEHAKKGQRFGYRKLWRTGKSEYAQALIDSVVPTIKRDMKRETVPQILKPPVEGASEKRAAA